MNNHELVKKVIGKITPTGNHGIDKERLENLKSMCSLVENLLYDIDDVIAKNKHSQERSVREIVLYAKNFLDNTVKKL